MKLFSKFKRLTGKKLFFLFAIFLSLSVAGLVGASTVNKTANIVDAVGVNCGDSSSNSIIPNGSGGTDKAARQRLINDIQASARLKKVYATFGLTQSDYQRFINEAKPGVATSNRTITVGGKVVATNVGSVGNNPNCQGTAPVRTFNIPGYPDVYGNWDEQGKAFAPGTTALPVDVLFNESGAVQFAVMSSTCANPTYQPNYVCHELKAQSLGDNKYSFTTDAHAGNGATITKLVYDFGDGDHATTTSPSDAVKHTFTKDSTVKVTVYVNVPGMGTVKLTNCMHKIKFTPPPVVAQCKNLTLTPGKVNDNGNTAYTLTATTHTENATPTNYHFHLGDGNGPVDSKDATIHHTYAPGTYQVEVLVTFKTDRGTKTDGNSGDCVKKLTVKPVNSTLACTDLDLKKGNVNSDGNTKYTLTATASAKNGATITSYTFYPADGSGPKTVNSHATTASLDHTYAPGTYNDIHVVVNGKDIYGKSISSDVKDCVKSLTVKPQPTNLVCDSLTPNKGTVDATGATSYTFTAKATPTNATITAYDFNFGDGNATQHINTGAASVTSQAHSYAPGKSYNVQVFVSGKDIYGNKFTKVSSGACKATFSVNKLPTNLTCDSLTPNKLSTDATTGATTYTFTAKATPTNATIDSYVFDFGNGATQTVPGSAQTVTSQQQTYAARNAAYHVKVVVNGTDIYGNKFTNVTSAACKTSFKVTTPECKPGVPQGSPECSTLTCVSLSLTAGTPAADGSVLYTLNATASKDNATITNYVFNFGDNTPDVSVPSSATTASTTHTYAPSTAARTAKVTVFGKDVTNAVISDTNANCQQPVTPTPPKNPSISIVKTVDHVKSEMVKVGQQFEYEIVVTNTSDVDITNATVTDQTPAGVTLVGADQGTIANNQWSIAGVDLAAHQSVTYHLNAVVNTYVAGSLVNTACVEAPPATPPNQPLCDHATVTVTPPVLAATTVLPNTGAGSVVGLFGLSAVIGTLGYRFVLSRRLGNS